MAATQIYLTVKKHNVLNFKVFNRQKDNGMCGKLRHEIKENTRICRRLRRQYDQKK